MKEFASLTNKEVGPQAVDSEVLEWDENADDNNRGNLQLER